MCNPSTIIGNIESTNLEVNTYGKCVIHQQSLGNMESLFFKLTLRNGTPPKSRGEVTFYSFWLF